MSKQPAKALTIGGSDSGGAAGIQADLKTWTTLGVYGMSVVTAVTAQNSLIVSAVEFIKPEMVVAQIDAVLSDYGAQALKTGLIGQVRLVELIAWRLQAHDASPLIVDPVLVNHKGQSMFSADLFVAYGEYLLPLAELVTPNWREAALLTGLDAQDLGTIAGLERAAEQLCELGANQVLITGVPNEVEVIDWWYDGSVLRPLSQKKIETENRHGSGDTLSAAICAYLAQGLTMADAIVRARQFTAHALAGAANWQLGSGHGPLDHFVNPE